MMLRHVLSALRGEPRTLDELARDLGSTKSAVEGMLHTLLAGRYVQEARANSDGCACTGCNLKSLCRSANQEAPPLHLLKLTPRGEAYLKRP